MKKWKRLSVLAVTLPVLLLAGCNPVTTTSSGTTSAGGTTSDVTTSSDTSSVVSSSSSSVSSSEEQKPFVKANYANGAKSYVAANYDERTKILGLLESYAVKNNLTGMTMFENGSYVMYNPDVVKGTNTYIPGYGFGVVSEGYINKGLEKETNAKWKKYYHTYVVSDPHTLNYQNDKGSVVGDIIGYTAGSYWTTQMNEFKDGYDWVPQFANSERPIPVNPDANGLATTYKFEVKVGNDLKYRTGSTALSKYNGRTVTLEDYVTPYKIYYTQAYGMARGNENLTGSGSIKGSAVYYNASQKGFDAEAWKNIGIKTKVENGKSYLEFTFNNPCNTFYAMYYLSSSMFAPVPEDFIKEIGGGDLAKGVAAWGNFTDGGYTPVDTWLSTGPYYVENWEKDLQIVFGKNDLYKCQDETRFKMEGVHFKILAAAKNDPNAVLNEFLLGTLHASGIPSDKLDQYRNDPRTTRTVGSSTFKLNFNTCTEAEWEALFGEKGSITQTKKDKYWKVEPAMSNDDFVAGLNFAFNREAFAEKYGRSPSANYFGNGYLSNPEEGIIYNNTDAHKNAVAKLQEGTVYGYNLEFAKNSFKKACDALIASGAYKKGDKIELEVAWQEPSDEELYHADVKKYWEDAFNACGGGLTLEVKFWAGTTWSDVYYNKMMVGQFDVGFGSVSGNALNPLNFLEVLKSDNSSGFTLNWGVDTNVVSEDLYYDGCYWSFDSLWQAADTGAYLVDGVVAPLFALKDATLGASNFVKNADGTVTVTIAADVVNVENASATVTKVAIFSHFFPEGAEEPVYDEDACTFKVAADKKSVVVTLSADLVAKYQDAFVYNGAYYNFGFDIYYSTTVCGIDAEGYKSTYILTPGDFPTVAADANA